MAAVTAFAVALVNVKLPLLIGELVNSIAAVIRENNATPTVFDHLYEPCKKLVLNYCIQSALTFVYIALLSSFGERLAARMRISLFKSIMEQDMAFFDEHKTGEVINRFVELFFICLI